MLELPKRVSLGCDPASLQAIRFQVYRRSGVKDIRLVNRDGSIACSAYSETLEFVETWLRQLEGEPVATTATVRAARATGSSG